MERYRSGHNEAVLKTVCPQGRMGSNPILSAENAGSAVISVLPAFFISAVELIWYYGTHPFRFFSLSFALFPTVHRKMECPYVQKKQ